MKILLAAINAKYVQTNLAIRLLKAYAEEHIEAVKNNQIQIELGEWNINQPAGAIVRSIFETSAEMVLFSTYVWNREMVLRIAEDVRKVMPNILIGFGGPEVSWSAEDFFHELSVADLIISGEGELSFVEVLARLSCLLSDQGGCVCPRTSINILCDIPGVYVRVFSNDGSTESIRYGENRVPIENLDIIPFPYSPERLDFDPAHRLVYYETSRGCPFSCAYCLSSIEKNVRYYSLDRVLKEIVYFMEAGFPLVKFVDRTFNLDPERYLAIWKCIRDQYNGLTLFHFEIAAEFLSDEAFEVLETMPEGSVQFEIGIQSINTETLRLVGRPAHPEKLAEKIRRIPKSIHIHVDLIAGLPAENLESFSRSFDYTFALNADMLQLGFLKILSGSPMEKQAAESPGYLWSQRPPYEVLSSPVLPFEHLLILKDVEHVVDVWHNSGLMMNTLRFLAREGASSFDLFKRLAAFTRSYFPDGDLFLPRRPSDSFLCMAAFLRNCLEPADKTDLLGHETTSSPVSARTEAVAFEFLRYDFLMQGKPGVFPAWFKRRYSKDAHDRALQKYGFFSSCNGSGNISRRTAYARTEYEGFAFSTNNETEYFLFIYSDVPGEKKTRCVKL